MGKQLTAFVLSLALLTGCASSLSQVQPAAYQIVSSGVSNDASLFIKYSTQTGQSWVLAGDGWQAMWDDEPLPLSNYLINVVTMVDRTYAAVRIDTVSGRSWSSINNRWVEIKTEKK